MYLLLFSILLFSVTGISISDDISPGYSETEELIPETLIMTECSLHMTESSDQADEKIIKTGIIGTVCRIILFSRDILDRMELRIDSGEDSSGWNLVLSPGIDFDKNGAIRVGINLTIKL